MAKFGICTRSYLPQRAEASDSSEMMSMILLGEPFEILKTDGYWHLVKNVFDQYEGWVFIRKIEHIDEDKVQSILNGNYALSADAFDLMTVQGESLTAGMGSVMPQHHNFFFRLGSQTVHHTGRAHQVFRKDIDIVLQVAQRLLGAPYLWGGRTSFGLDCSGFVQLIFRFAGVLLPRDTGQQAEKGTGVLPADSKKGDLAFFMNKEGKINHVGMLLDDNEIIHASEYVRIDTLDEQGIYNETLKKHTHEFSHLTRVI